MIQRCQTIVLLLGMKGSISEFAALAYTCIRKYAHDRNFTFGTDRVL